MRRRWVLGDGSQRATFEGLLTFGGAFLAAVVIAYVTLIAIYAKGRQSGGATDMPPLPAFRFCFSSHLTWPSTFRCRSQPWRCSAWGSRSWSRRFRGAFERSCSVSSAD